MRLGGLANGTGREFIETSGGERTFSVTGRYGDRPGLSPLGRRALSQTSSQSLKRPWSGGNVGCSFGVVVEREDGVFCMAGRVSLCDTSEAGMANFRNVEFPELCLLNSWLGRVEAGEVSRLDGTGGFHDASGDAS